MTDDKPASSLDVVYQSDANPLFASLWDQIAGHSPADAIPATAILLSALIALAAEDLDDAGKMVVANAKAIMQTIVTNWDTGRDLRQAAILQAQLTANGLTVTEDGDAAAACRKSQDWA